MKKIAASLLSALMCLSVLCVFGFAGNNPEIEVEYTKVAPKQDGEVKTGEYGFAPIHKVDYSTGEFGTEFDEDKSIKADFYATWDEDSLYLAWVVDSELDKNYAPVKGGEMWQHCCVQFILTTGAPDSDTKKYQTSDWSGDYLEIGLCLADDGENYKVNWSMPSTASQQLTPDDWDFAGAWANGKMTYECRIPWEKSGVLAVGNDVKLGLTYAIGDQEKFDEKDKSTQNMVEWPDAILGKKNADAAAIVTLKGKEDDKVTEVSQSGSGTDVSNLPELNITVPDDVIADTKFTSTLINQNIASGGQVVVTDGDIKRNYQWSTAVLLAPTDKENVYSVVEVIPNGGGKELAFTNSVTDDSVVVCLHGGDDNTVVTDSSKLTAAWSKLVAGDLVTFNGYNLAEGKLTHKNPVVYVQSGNGTVPSTSSDDASSIAESSVAESSEVEESKDESSKVTSTTSDTSKDESKGENKKEGGSMTWLWIVIAVVAVAAVGAGVFVVIKNKKAE